MIPPEGPGADGQPETKRAGASKFEWLQASTDIRAWDTVLTRSDWVQVWTTGRVFTGHPQFVTSSAETDDLDFYLETPNEVFEDGDQDPLPGSRDS